MNITNKTEFAAGTAAIIVVLVVVYGMWTIGRVINYSLSYEDMVQETICEMVKPEHLKTPCK